MRIDIDTKTRTIRLNGEGKNEGDTFTVVTNLNVLPLVDCDTSNLQVIIDNNLVVKYDNANKVESGELDIQGSAV